MTSKKDRQRGSRTHGGGTHKNRRGAGNRGGRGDAGRDKHEFHNYPSLGKIGFSRPPKLETEYAEVNIRQVDESITGLEISNQIPEQPNFAIEVEKEFVGEDRVELSEELDPITRSQISDSELGIWQPDWYSGFCVDLRVFSEEYQDSDQVKLLNTGRLNHAVTVVTDEISLSAKRQIQSMNGKIVFSKTGRRKSTQIESQISKRFFKNQAVNLNKTMESLAYFDGRLDDGDPLEFYEFDQLIRSSESEIQPESTHEIIKRHANLISEPSGLDAVTLLMGREFADAHGFDTRMFDEKIAMYFAPLDLSEDYVQYLREGMPDSMSVDDVLEGLDEIYDDYNSRHYQQNQDLRESRIEPQEREYLKAAEEIVDWI